MCLTFDSFHVRRRSGRRLARVADENDAHLERPSTVITRSIVAKTSGDFSRDGPSNLREMAVSKAGEPILKSALLKGPARLASSVRAHPAALSRRREIRRIERAARASASAAGADRRLIERSGEAAGSSRELDPTSQP